MSELLQLAKQLRSLSDDELAALIKRRQVQTGAADFLDLAQQLLTPKSIESCLATLTLRELELLDTLGSASVESAGLLLSTGLVVAEGTRLTILDSVSQAMPNLKTTEPLEIKQLAATENLAGLAAIAAFETQLAITEIILDAEQRILRVVIKSSFGLPDVKSLANQLHKGLDFARHCYQMASRLGLLHSSDSRWWLTGLAQNWLSAEPIDRWELLARDWVSSLGPQAVAELSQLLTATTDLRSTLAQVFPFADRSLSDRLTELANQAEWLGLAVSSQPTTALLQLLKSDLTGAKATIAEHLPKAERKLLAQGDQTLVATGPLPTELEMLVRTFAQLEQVSLACTYRLTEQSVTFGLECGLSESLIRTTLEELTSAKLPQPMDYLITQAANRFGRIRISAGSGAERSLITASDSVLLSELLNDQRLRPFAFQPVTASSIGSRFEPEVLYYGLRENGFLAVRVDPKGGILSPKQAISWRLETETGGKDAVSLMVNRLREVESRVGQNPTDDDLLRQIQLAIKNRATIKVQLSMRDGTSVDYLLKVSGLANGRLRGLDAKADAERVLPLSQITRVEF